MAGIFFAFFYNSAKNDKIPPMEQKIKADYQKELDAILANMKQITGPSSQKPSLLLHACCGPCSSYVIEYLSEYFNITIYYYNPNIFPQAEYERRLEELQKFLPRFEKAVANDVKLVKEYYDSEEFYSATKVREEKELQTQSERGERCRRCYEFRMKKAFAYAKENGFDYFTTTLSISPHKDAQMINEIGRALENTNTADDQTKFLPSDFKKRNGYLRSTQISKEYGLWRQDYCGCAYSKANNSPKASPLASVN